MPNTLLGIMTANNIFVLGLDDFNRGELQSIRQAESCRFIALIDYEEIFRTKSGEIDFEGLRRRAKAQLASHRGTIDGIVEFWDFPTSALGGVLRNELGLPGASNEAIARCEHKYWSRLEQVEVVPGLVPRFRPFDPFAADPLQDIDLDFPFWIKPVKAHSSYLGFKIRGPEDFRLHLPEIRRNIGHFGRPFDEYLRHVDVPAQVAAVNGHWCIAEAIISAGQQCTLEGYVHGGKVEVYGVVDSIRSGKHRSCFARYQYPSRLPRRVQERMAEAAARVMTRYDYDCAPFNMEFFWDRRTDEVRLLEVNARISKSHCPLFRMVDGASHQEVLIDLAHGQRPAFPYRQGEFKLAAKFMLRVFEDGIVRQVPDRYELASVSELFPEARIRLTTSEGVRLTHMSYQDSYSYELAEIFLGADSQAELLQKYARCLEMLTFDIVPLQDRAA